MTAPTQTTRAQSRQGFTILAWVAFGVACAANLYGIYAPSQPGPALFDGADKVFHLLSFALVMATGMLAGIPGRWLALALVVHAVGSELIQHLLLPNRSGDPLDVLADAIGITLGALLAWPLTRLVRRRIRWTPAESDGPAGTDPDR